MKVSNLIFFICSYVMCFLCSSLLAFEDKDVKASTIDEFNISGCGCNNNQDCGPPRKGPPGPRGPQGPTGSPGPTAYFSAFTSTGALVNSDDQATFPFPDFLNTSVRVLGPYADGDKIPFPQLGPSSGVGTVFNWNSGLGDNTLTFLQAGTFEVTYGLSVYLGLQGLFLTGVVDNFYYSAGVGANLDSAFLPQLMLVFWYNHNNDNFSLNRVDGSQANVQFKTISSIIQVQANQQLSIKALLANIRRTSTESFGNVNFYLGSVIYTNDPTNVPTLGFLKVRQLQ